MHCVLLLGILLLTDIPILFCIRRERREIGQDKFRETNNNVLEDEDDFPDITPEPGYDDGTNEDAYDDNSSIKTLPLNCDLLIVTLGVLFMA